MDDVVPPLLGQRPGGAVRITGLSVQVERIAGECIGLPPRLGALACACERQQRVGDQDRIAHAQRDIHGGLAHGGRVLAGHALRPRAESAAASMDRACKDAL